MKIAKKLKTTKFVFNWNMATTFQWIVLFINFHPSFIEVLEQHFIKHPGNNIRYFYA